ncbi:MAG: rRNA maturation RNase YbeY [Candidatus Colwellbacteria bacterium]|nr:rRNA maturation RNase YbeY [Candidatus Colwellbacteria bacterium]
MGRRNEVVVVALDKRYKKLEKGLIKTTEKAFDFLRQSGVKVEIYLVGTSRIRALNRQYRGRDEATNVLAYESPGFPEPQSSRRLLGEIYLCPPYIKGKREDIGFLLVHGLLHLVGFNHQKESDRMTMVRMEKQLIQWLNR